MALLKKICSQAIIKDSVIANNKKSLKRILAYNQNILESRFIPQLKFLEQSSSIDFSYPDRRSLEIGFEKRIDQQTLNKLNKSQKDFLIVAFQSLKNPAKYLLDFEQQLKQQYQLNAIKLTQPLPMGFCESSYGKVPIFDFTKPANQKKILILEDLFKKTTQSISGQNSIDIFHGTVPDDIAKKAILHRNIFSENAICEDMIIHGSWTHACQLMIIHKAFLANGISVKFGDFVKIILQENIWNPLLDAVARYDNFYGGVCDYTNPHSLNCAFLNNSFPDLKYLSDAMQNLYQEQFVKIVKFLTTDQSKTSDVEFCKSLIQQMIFASFFREERKYPIVTVEDGFITSCITKNPHAKKLSFNSQSPKKSL